MGGDFSLLDFDVGAVAELAEPPAVVVLGLRLVDEALDLVFRLREGFEASRLSFLKLHDVKAERGGDYRAGLAIGQGLDRAVNGGQEFAGMKIAQVPALDGFRAVRSLRRERGELSAARQLGAEGLGVGSSGFAADWIGALGGLEENLADADASGERERVRGRAVVRV